MNVISTDRFRKPRSIYVIEGDAEQVAKVICEGIKRRTKVSKPSDPKDAA